MHPILGFKSKNNILKVLNQLETDLALAHVAVVMLDEPVCAYVRELRPIPN